MGMRSMEELKDMLCEEVDKMTKKGSISRSDLETLEKLLVSVKAIDTIAAMEEGSDHSERRSYGSYGSYNNSYYDNGRSGARYVRGHYSRGEDDMMMERMQSMMEDRNMSSEDRQTLKRAMDMMRR